MGSAGENPQLAPDAVYESLTDRACRQSSGDKHMARGINKVILVGNLGADPETRYMPSGGAVTNISIATSEQWTDKTTNEKQERTEWHRVVLFNRLGEIAAEYLRKGSQVYIEGSIRTDKYQDKQTGQDRYSTQIIAREMQLLGGREGGAQGGGQAGGQGSDMSGQQGGGASMATGSGFDAGTSSSGSSNASAGSPANDRKAEPVAAGEFDDDVPF